MLIQLSAPLCPTDLRARFVEFAGIFLTYACITVWWLWPSPASWPTHLFYASDDDISFAVLQRADSYLILWSLAWGARALTSNPWNLFNGNTFYPSPLSLAFSEHLLGYFPLFAPTYLITHNPVLAANVLTFLTYPLSGICMYAYARRHVGASAAFASGVAYAFYPARYLTPPHYHMLGVQYFPLILHALERWVESAKLRHAILLWVAITMQCLSSVYLMYAVALLLVVAVPFTAWSDRQKIDRRRIIGLAAALGAAVLVIAAAMYPYLVLQAHGLVPSYDSNRISLGLVPWISRIHVRRYLVSDGLGIAGYALAACGLLLGRLVDRGVARVLGATL